jgi:hypothetical protein
MSTHVVVKVAALGWPALQGLMQTKIWWRADLRPHSKGEQKLAWMCRALLAVYWQRLVITM